MSYRVRTQVFSGPFDLLLNLVMKQKVAIGSISISEVTDQYLDEVHRMGQLDLDVASDFVLVASTLLDIKAASLVPEEETRQPVDDLDEDDDLSDLSPDQVREVLIQRLIAYKQYRNVAGALAARAEAEGRMVPRTAGPDPEFLGLMPDFLENVKPEDLARLCAGMNAKRHHFLLEAEHIAPKRLPVALTVASVDRITRTRGKVTFSDLLDGDTTPETVVATFLAMLELFKRGSIRVQQLAPFARIDIERVAGAPAFELDDEALTSIGEED